MLGTLVRKGVKAGALIVGPVARRRAGDVVILLYHRVGAGNREIDLPAEGFDQQLSQLADGQHVIDIGTALSGEGGVVLTFDDGTRDFHEHVLPRLMTYRLPAVLYLATGLVANGNGNSPEALSWSHLREAVESGLVSVGSHTHAHADLSTADEGAAEDEMRRSRELIEDRLGVACRHFAYPWAVGSPAADRVARRLFDSAALDAWQTNRRGRTDPHRLGRTPVLRADGPMFFRAKAAGMLDAERLAYRALGRGPWRKS